MKAADWTTEPLRKVTTKIGTGATPRGGSDAYQATGIPLIRSLNVYDDGFREEGLAYLNDEQASRLDNVIVQEGDVLLNITGASVARCCIAPEQYLPARVNQHVSIIRPRPDVLCHTFLHYSLIAGDCKKRLLDAGEGGGTTRQAITKAQLQDFRISYPPLPEQRRIVAILDEAFKGIAAAKASAETNLRNAKSVLIAHLSEVFASGMDAMEMATVKEIAHHCLGKMLDRKKNRGTPRPYLRNTNVRWFTFDLGDVLEMRFEKDEENKFSARQGDLLICEGGYPGRAAVWDGAEPMFIQKAIHRVRFHNRKYTNWFLYYLFWLEQTGRLRRYCTGTGILHFTGKSLAALPVPLPSDSDADRHSRTFEQLRTTTNRACETLSRKLSALDELKASLLHQAFSGNL